MARTRWPLLLTTLALLTDPGPVRAGGFSNLDFGMRRMGMLAVTAYPDDGAAIFHNPAGLMLQPGTQFYYSQTVAIIDMGLRMYDSAGQLQPTDHEIEPSWNLGILPFLTFSSDLGGMERLRVGFGVYAPNAYGAALPEDEPTRYHATQALFIASRATAAVAYALSDKMTLAASVSLIHVYLTATRIMNPEVLLDPDRRFDSVEQTRDQDATLEIDGQDLTWGADVGVLFHPLPTFHLGASFSKGSPVELEGNARLTHPDGRVEEATQHTTLVIPFNLRAGFNWEFAPDFQVGADIYYWNYQVFQEQLTTLDQPIMYLSEFRDPKNYTSSWNWCVGLLYRVTPALDLMFGYQEDKTPIPKATYTLENPTTDLKGVSMGLRWRSSDDLRLGLAVVRNWYDLIDVQNSIGTPPSNMKGHGGNTEIGFDLSYRF